MNTSNGSMLQQHGLKHFYITHYGEQQGFLFSSVSSASQSICRHFRLDPEHLAAMEFVDDATGSSVSLGNTRQGGKYTLRPLHGASPLSPGGADDMITFEDADSRAKTKIRYVESPEWRSNLEYTLCAAFNIPNEEAELELTVGMNSEFFVIPLADVSPSISHSYIVRQRRSAQVWWKRDFRTMDPVHNMICLPSLCKDIIDTPEFQRLRDLTQLGATSYVFDGGVHSRFEHSIGAAHLAQTFATGLRDRQPHLGISQKDVVCVTVAALCHDLGHGPFSHTWESCVLPSMGIHHHEHEQVSLKLLDAIVNRLTAEDKSLPLNCADVKFVKNCIDPPKPAKLIELKESGEEAFLQEVGRPVAKAFLLDIVANKRTGLDVDKFDYIMRQPRQHLVPDCHHSGVQGECEVPRLIMNAKILMSDGFPTICWPDKEFENLCAIFRTRESLHRRMYQHRTVKAVEAMIKEAFKLAAPHIEIKGLDENGSEAFKSLSESIEDPRALCVMTNWLAHYIEHAHAVRFVGNQVPRIPALERASQILKDIQRRKIWKVVVKFSGVPEPGVIEKICSHSTFLEPDSLELAEAAYNWGMGENNPMEHVRFVSKCGSYAVHMREPELAIQGGMLPSTFKEQYTSIICRSADPKLIAEAERCVKAYRAETVTESTLADKMVAMTPVKYTSDLCPRNRRVRSSEPAVRLVNLMAQ
ncbi:SAM domain and HD domain-containing protein, putative [Perkinsus marinus ATCC 50983]|uniref:SAM domain and HD domain-containing protein, putative n=1 Tax=Perkinsus marinus (strain ATCC 50983 / TXsc) TaxID=423536 RepID=C5LHH8_PERM5|nr:SAM domain and HD domain-containing protein, putative [Perkinsus marinus ATCC 50983]EER03828.1 SAM domain and HD domain-containing protein, putative [Perkinsus marinus ATCC 50983]|eukprot:XP_002772012.1 SAM domain and HD domain-containing protein, putative [Perkinsus marinus ATCC 50983]